MQGSAWGAAAYLAPAAVIYLAFVGLPIAASAYVSLTTWNGIAAPVFVGLSNYAAILTDPRFLTALRNNAVFLLFYAVVPIMLGLVLSDVIARAGRRERLPLRILFFLPYVMPLAVLGVIWRWLYNPAFGPIDQVLRGIGLPGAALAWLGDFSAALPAVGFVAVWYFTGFCTVLFLGGLQRLDPAMMQAAALDGASPARAFWSIAVPNLRPELRIAALLTVIASVKAFDLVFVMTRGGPGTSTLVTNIYMYENGFQLNRFGYAAAVAIIGAVLVFALNGFIHLLFKDR
jgi:raffinose/stachyose/melibiose transport system permease protein